MTPTETATPADDLLRFLQQMRRLRAETRTPAAWHCHGPEDFILTHGRPWATAPKPAAIRWGPRKACFGNAYRLAVRHPEFVYVEGYAIAHIAVHHAWVVDRAGVVIDNTWRPDRVLSPRDFAYYGVPFKTDYVVDMAARQQCFGVLYPNQVAGRGGWTLMTDDPAMFLHPLEVT
jgi:hypothetical protein